MQNREHLCRSLIVRQNNFENIQLNSLKKLYDIDYMCEKNN